MPRSEMDGGNARRVVVGGVGAPTLVAAQPPVKIFAAVVMNPDTIAEQKAVIVGVRIDGIRLVDPVDVGEQPKPSEGHLHYQVDGGPVIATTVTRLSFQNLTPGEHVITVQLAGNDHKPIGPPQVLTAKIP